MGDPALDIKKDPLSIEGLDDVFTQDRPDAMSRGIDSVLDRTDDSSGSVQAGPVRLTHPISVDEAAALLNISTNAVCKRLRKGSLVGKKIPGKFKEEWLVEGAGLIEVVSIDFRKVQDSPSEHLHTTLADQDQTEDSSGSVQVGPDQPMGRLLDLVEKQAAKLEAAAGQIGYLQAQLESQRVLIEDRDTQIKLLIDRQQKTGWWARFCKWFVTGSGGTVS